MKITFLERWLAATGFEMYPIETDFLNDLIENTPIYKMALQKNKTERFYKEIDERLAGKIASNFNTMMVGPPGKSKSWSMLYIGQYEMEKMGKEFDVDKLVAFDKTELLIKLSKVVREEIGTSINNFLKSGKLVRIKTAMGLDEDTPPAGKGKVVEDRMLLNIEKTVRQAQICFNYCSPKIESHIYTQILDFFAINFEEQMSVAWLINPATLKPIGIVYVGLASNNIIAKYEMMKSKFLFKAGRGRFGGGRISLKKDIAKELIKYHYDDLKKCSFKRDQMQYVEEVTEGRLTEDEQEDVYSRLVREKPELDRRPRKKNKVRRE